MRVMIGRRVRCHALSSPTRLARGAETGRQGVGGDEEQSRIDFVLRAEMRGRWRTHQRRADRV